MKRVYVCGPMSGIAQFNFPAFDAAAEDLRARGYDVVSPAELDDPESREAALTSVDGTPSDVGESWGDFLARDVKLLADDGIEGLVCLPGWEQSKGARLETFVARLCGLEIRRYVPDHDPLPPVDLLGIEAAHGVELPTGEVRVVNPATGGEKGRKPERYSLLPWEQLDEVARLYAAGAAKYSDHNWTRGYDWSLSYDSLIRHARSWWLGEETDGETGCSHMASVIFHALALMYFAEHHQQLDDRPPTTRRAPCPATAPCE